MVLLNAAVSYGIVRLNAPVTAAFNMKQTVDAFFDSASQKQLSEAHRTRHWKPACSVAAKTPRGLRVACHRVRGLRISPGKCNCPANESGTMRCRWLPADMGRVWPPPNLAHGAICGRLEGTGHPDGDRATPDRHSRHSGDGGKWMGDPQQSAAPCPCPVSDAQKNGVV